MNTIQGIQMIGTQRSGSNLLRVMLDGIREIAAPHPPHILQRFLPLLPKYGDLTDQSNFYRLAQDVCELVTVNPVPWEGITIRADEVVAACRQQTLYELFRVIYESAARQTGASFWLCKSMKNMLYAEGIESTGISPYYIYLYRDGRDVALSFKKAIVGEKHIYALAENWKKDQEAALRLKDRTAADHFFMLKDNTKKFLRELSSEDIAIFESVAGDLLQQLGYSLYTPLDLLKGSFSDEEIVFFNEENIRLKNVFIQQADPADLAKRRPQDELINRIKQY